MIFSLEILLTMNMSGDHTKNYCWPRRELLFYSVEAEIRVQLVVVVLISWFAGFSVLFLPTQQGYWFLC